MGESIKPKHFMVTLEAHPAGGPMATFWASGSTELIAVRKAKALMGGESRVLDVTPCNGRPDRTASSPGG
jgi:hypothetical protein